MLRVLESVGWAALVGAAFLSPVRASATPAAPDDPAFEAPLPVVQRDLHFRFYLEPSTGGVRTLLLRDDADLEITIGDVERNWACDSQVRLYGGGRADRGLQVACGGGALFASLDVWEERDRRASLELHTSTGSTYEIPFGHGAKAWLDPQLVDPAAGSCDDAGRTRGRSTRRASLTRPFTRTSASSRPGDGCLAGTSFGNPLRWRRTASRD